MRVTMKAAVRIPATRLARMIVIEQDMDRRRRGEERRNERDHGQGHEDPRAARHLAILLRGASDRNRDGWHRVRRQGHAGAPQRFFRATIV